MTNVAVRAPGLMSRLSPTSFGVAVGALTAAAAAVVVSSAAVMFAYSFGGFDAVAGRVSGESGGAWFSELASRVAAETVHSSMMVMIGCGLIASVVIGVAAGLIARRVKREQIDAVGRRLHAQRDAIESAVWQKVAEALSGTVDGKRRVSLVDAAHRLLGDGDREPPVMFDGESLDRVPAASRMVRMYGPFGSGKSVCARRLIVQDLDSGRHVTVIRSGENSYCRAEYDVGGVDTAQLDVVDEESLSTGEARRAWASRFDRRSDRRSDSGAAETIVVDAGNALDIDDVGDLVSLLAQVVVAADRRARLVVLVSDPDDLSDLDAVFDTEIVLPGRAEFADTERIRCGLRRLTGDELTLSRLWARVRGGGLATSDLEREILDWFDGDTRKYLSKRSTRIVEGAQPVTCGFLHGILKGPDGAISEFSLPVISDQLGAEPNAAVR